MLTAITLDNFKSYRKARLPLAELTVLIGANASGKSNLLEGLRLLSWLAQGHKLSSLSFASQADEQLIRGTMRDLGYQGIEKFGLGVQTSANEWNQFSLEITRRPDGLYISQERLTHDGSTVALYEVDQPTRGHGTDIKVLYNNFEQGKSQPIVTCTDQMAIFSQLTSPATFAESHAESKTVIPQTTRDLESWLSAVLFLDPEPAQMRSYAFPVEKKLQGSGRNLSAVLHNLWGSNEQATTEPYRSNRQAILGFIQSLPEQDIVELDFLIEPRGGVMVQLTETFGGQEYKRDASLLSDGTLRVLAIAAAMLSAPEGSLVVIEEIDNGVHPSRAHHLLQHIQRIAQQRHLRILLSTHNPAMLDALPDTAVPNVVFCYRNPEDGASCLVRLEDLPDYPELIAQGTLGRLMTSGALERFVKQQPDGEERKQRALQWLDRLRTGTEYA